MTNTLNHQIANELIRERTHRNVARRPATVRSVRSLRGLTARLSSRS